MKITRYITRYDYEKFIDKEIDLAALIRTGTDWYLGDKEQEFKVIIDIKGVRRNG